MLVLSCCLEAEISVGRYWYMHGLVLMAVSRSGWTPGGLEDNPDYGRLEASRATTEQRARVRARARPRTRGGRDNARYLEGPALEHTAVGSALHARRERGGMIFGIFRALGPT